jgi:protein TonB
MYRNMSGSMSGNMFGTLENTWDSSARRRWSTLVSFTMQTLGLSLLIAISLIWVGGPPRVHWLQIAAPAAFTAPTAAQPAHAHTTTTVASTLLPRQIVAPQSIPLHVVAVNDTEAAPSAPDWSTIDCGSCREPGGGVSRSIGEGIPVAIPQRPGVIKPLLVSHLAEANLLHRVQPIYPSIARQAGVHGAVELRAIISKTGTIENLVVVSGHPMLVQSAIEAVRQWRYRPYLLNNEPIEVETEITVNFLLSGG